MVLSLTTIKGYGEGDRIVGGNEVDAHSIPWQVGIMTEGDVFCGGTIITSKIILTAAHCKLNEPLESIYVIVGEHSLLSSEDGVRHNITAWKNHPDYGVQAEVDDDFAIIVLKHPLSLETKLRLLVCQNQEMIH